MDRDGRVWLLGVCHRRAPASVRERVVYDESSALTLLGALRRERSGVEAMVLSTCNRTEVYLAGPADHDVPAVFAAAHERAFPGGLDRVDVLREHERRDDDAVAHLVRVACGLESAIPGDAQVIGQLRRALDVSRRAGAIGPWLSQASAVALRAGRRVRRETELGRAQSGIGRSVAGVLERRIAAHGPRPARVLVLGAGQAARDVARELARRDGVSVVVSNRDDGRASALAYSVGGAAVPWARWRRELTSVDALVCATASREPIVGGDELDTAFRAGRLRLVVDAGHPPNVVTEGRDRVVSLDELQQAERARAAVPPAVTSATDAIVGAALGEWREWRSIRRLDRCVGALYSDAASVAGTIADDLAPFVDAPSEELARVVRARVRSMLDRHVRALREVVRSPERTDVPAADPTDPDEWCHNQTHRPGLAPREP